MTHTKGNISEAARVARMDRSHLRTLLKKYGVRGGDDPGEAGS
jgi:DNA-binding protein Fis